MATNLNPRDFSDSDWYEFVELPWPFSESHQIDVWFEHHEHPPKDVDEFERFFDQYYIEYGRAIKERARKANEEAKANGLPLPYPNLKI